MAKKEPTKKMQIPNEWQAASRLHAYRTDLLDRVINQLPDNQRHWIMAFLAKPQKEVGKENTMWAIKRDVDALLLSHIQKLAAIAKNKEIE